MLRAEHEQQVSVRLPLYLQYDDLLSNTRNFCLFPAELKMDVIREREVKDSLERQLVDERKLRSKFNIIKYIKQQQKTPQGLFDMK